MNINPSKLASSDNAYGIVDSRYPFRWLASWGDVETAIVDSVWKADEFTVTATGTSPITASALSGAVALITSGASDFDGDNIQVVGSRFSLAAGKPLYFGAKLTINEATQSDLLVGLCGIDTTLTSASTTHAINVGASGVFFSKLDAVTAAHFKTYDTATETNTAAAFTMDTSAHIYEMYWDGYKLFGYVDGVLIGTFTASIPAAVLTPSIAFRTGSAAAKTCTIHWMRCFQVRS